MNQLLARGSNSTKIALIYKGVPKPEKKISEFKLINNRIKSLIRGETKKLSRKMKEM